MNFKNRERIDDPNQNGATTFSIMTLSIKGLIVILSIKNNLVECRFFIAMLSVIMLSVVMLSVIMLSVSGPTKTLGACTIKLFTAVIQGFS